MYEFPSVIHYLFVNININHPNSVDLDFHSRSRSQIVGPASPFLEPPPVVFVRPVSVLLPRFLHHPRNRSQLVGPGSPFGLEDVDSRSRSQIVGPGLVRPISLPLFSSNVVSIVETVQNVFTFCFCLRISASLKNYCHKFSFIHTYIKL